MIKKESSNIKGSLTAQIIEAARQSSGDIDKMFFGDIIVHVQKGKAWRMEINISKILDERTNKREE